MRGQEMGDARRDILRAAAGRTHTMAELPPPTALRRPGHHRHQQPAEGVIWICVPIHALQKDLTKNAPF
jgi:hypothetical protein